MRKLRKGEVSDPLPYKGTYSVLNRVTSTGNKQDLTVLRLCRFLEITS